MTSLGERIIAAREKAGLTQADLARELKISPGSLWRNEQKGVVPQPERLAAIAQIVGCDLEWLATGRTPEEQRADSAIPDPEGLAAYLASGDGQQLTDVEREAMRMIGRAIEHAGRVPTPFTYAGVAGILRSLSRVATKR